MIAFFIISSVISITIAQEPSLSCRYVLYGEVYSCDFTINNPNGWNNFTGIGGIHLEGFTNADVDTVYRVSGVSTNIPTIICETFPNLNLIGLYFAGLTAIGDSDFASCSRITELGLSANSITSISSNAFASLPDLVDINLDMNSLTTLPENVFANQRNLRDLDLSLNPFHDIPAGVFRPLENLQFLHLIETNLTAINNQWFASNERLIFLNLQSNRIALTAESFVGLEALRTLDLTNNMIDEIPEGAFTHLQNLQNLNLFDNGLTVLRADSFTDLRQLEILEISRNPIQVIETGAFHGLENLLQLSLSRCRLRQLQSNTFEDLVNLNNINLNFNEIDELPWGIFDSLSNLSYVGLWSNRLKTVRRNAFGQLENLQALDLDENIVNAVDRAIIDDATNLDTLSFTGNLCADNYFANFRISRPQFLPMLDTCFRNMRYIIDTVTEGDDAFSFFEAPNPGIVLRVNTDNEIQISLTPFEFAWRPMIEIFIGTSNNTRSIIRMNEETNVVTVPTLNIISPGQWNDFRVTWVSQSILVFYGIDRFPFMAFTMQDFFPVNFYGLRAVETRALWSVQPLE
ncbi:Leucine-rich repeat-containing protein 15 [Pseudolycoriella hygida]|uniref:Leucine-rich repeat-containing protein 15 n=1 Tax=Pseudolycoriella hygida TaxID=35572 RepID=A0A9Q0N1U8_9DIPT|nr:Leucine-rich repeat-containing protein 15 [Pseudolycoriella hygida]